MMTVSAFWFGCLVTYTMLLTLIIFSVLFFMWNEGRKASIMAQKAMNDRVDALYGRNNREAE